MPTGTKRKQVSVHSNGKPRAIRSGNWTWECHGYEHVAVDIQCFVKPEELLSGRRAFIFRLPTPQHCELLADWFAKAAVFARRQSKQRTAGQQDAGRRTERRRSRQ